MHRMIVFDLDGTLCEIGRGMTTDDVAALRHLEKLGYRIAICSGKPTYYLCGFMRQIELVSPILIGENGAVTQYGVDLPPAEFYIHPHSDKAVIQLNNIKEHISRECTGSIWYQPNVVGVTPFPGDAQTFEQIQKLVNDNKEQLDELEVYRHSDSFDFTPKNISKYSALELLCEREHIDRSDVIAVGDGINDIPMFDFSDISILIGDKLNYAADMRFDTIGSALKHMINEKL